MTQLQLFESTAHVSLIERFAQEGRQRIVDGIVDAYGCHRPEGPRMKLTVAQQRAYDLALRERTSESSFHMEHSIRVRTTARR
jgi:hypothetical protein